MPYAIEQTAARFAKAKELRQPWEHVWQECYDYGLPGRKGFHNRTVDTGAFDRLFDTTAVDSLSEFANNLQQGLTAPMAKSFQIVPDADLESGQRYDSQKELDALRDLCLQMLEDANSDLADPETFADTGCVGQGFQLLPERPGQWPPMEIMPVPAAECWLLQGPYGQPDGVARANRAPLAALMVEYPEASWGKLHQDLLKKDANALVEVIEVVERDWTADVETYDYCLYCETGPVKLQGAYFIGYGANPWVYARWTGAAGDYYGRAPMLAALPLAKTLNLSTEMVLENAEMALSGMWQMEGSDVINPSTIQLVPGTIIPKVPGTSGLEPLQTPQRFDVGQMLQNNFTAQIKNIFFNVDLGPMDKTPMSAEEARARVAKSLKRMGASYLRLKAEFVERRIYRGIHLLIKNEFIAPPKIRPDRMRVRVISPLARAVSMEAVERVSNHIGTMASLYGPRLATMMSKPARVNAYIAEAFQVPAELVPSPEELEEQMQQAMGGIQQAEQAAPGTSQPLIEAVSEALPTG